VYLIETYWLPRTRTLDKVRTEMSLHVLAYNIKRVIAIIGAVTLMAAIRTWIASRKPRRPRWRAVIPGAQARTCKLFLIDST
jgi:hypothetical protein